MADELYDDPELYDLVAPPDADMEQFYASVAGGAGREVLELACGTGRLTRPVAATGARVTGGDLSEGMLARARGQGGSIDYVTVDMRAFELGRQFDAVFMGANSLLHLHAREDLVACFRAVARHLKPGGRFAFDVFAPSVRMLARPAGQRETMDVFRHSRLGEVRIEETMDYDPVSQVSRIEWYWSTAAEPDFRQTRLEIRQIFPEELPLLLEAGGLRLVERFGGFDRSAFTAKSWRQVCVAEAG